MTAIPVQAAKNPEASGNVRIRVRLAEALPKVSIRGYDLRMHDGPSRTLAAQVDKASDWELRCHDGRVRAIQQGTGRTLSLTEPVTVSSPAGFVTFRGRPYRERLHVRSVGSMCDVVNEVDLERYLDGLVNSEFSSRWNEEAIGAQVVAARTYALHQIRNASRDAKSHHDVDATIRDQVYDGSLKEDYRANRAVNRTRGLVLTTGPGNDPAPVKAFYHSTCGGVTELPERVWGARHSGFKRTVRCPYCSVAPRFRWDLSLSAREITAAIARGTMGDGPVSGWPANWSTVLARGKLVAVRAAAGEGRVGSVVTTWSMGDKRVELVLPANRFRDWMGTTKLKSTAFEIVPAAAKGFSFRGRGNGHGVGMCQWGAKVMGEKGFKTAAILKHYYPDMVLRKLW